jgi:hypothetical protein
MTNKMILTMLAADTREYSMVRDSAIVAVTSSPADIQLTSEGRGRRQRQNGR